MNGKMTAIAVAVGIIGALVTHFTASQIFGAEYLSTQAEETTLDATSPLATTDASRTTRTTQQARSTPAATPAPTSARFVITQGTTVEAKIVTPISSRTAGVGDRVEAVTTEEIWSGNRLVIPAGATVIGRVSSVRPAVETRTAAELNVSFHSIGGHATRLALVSPDLEARARAANRAVDAALVTGGAVAGGVIGHQIDHKRGSTIGAIGGAVVGATAAANVGANVQLKVGEAATLRFQEALAID